MEPDFDLLVIGGGVNGCGIARDASGRGLSVCLTEMKDIGWATSSASTKLFHGGLRYLEYFEFRLVREALMERETLLKAMPHIAWPMRFVLPYHYDMRFDLSTPTSKLLKVFMPWMKGRRPAWLIRLGLFIYDNLGGRNILSATTNINLDTAPEGKILKAKFKKAYEYSDCWVEDNRLVVLNARDAQQHGAQIRVGEKVISAKVEQGIWVITLLNLITKKQTKVTAKMLINAAGPWVSDVLHDVLKSNHKNSVRLVRGSHIVTKRLFEHDKCYFFQGTDGRISFAIPYENDFTLIGTTDVDHEKTSFQPECTNEERDYLIGFVNQYLVKPIHISDIVWTYSGIRPLYDDGSSSASSATRDYVLQLDHSHGAPALNVFGGKITTYRCLAESALKKIEMVLGKTKIGPWTAGVALPGGDFEVGDFEKQLKRLGTKYDFLSYAWARRLMRAYGTEAFNIMADAKTANDLGIDFGATLTEREVLWLIEKEYARTAEDIVWRRTKLGLRMDKKQIETLSDWIKHR